MKNYSILLCFLLGLNVLAGNAQTSISGIVSDEKDKTTLLAGVEIFIPELNRTDFSREGGTYIFRNVAKGVYSLHFYKVGYRIAIQTISALDSGNVLHVELIPFGGTMMPGSIAFSGTAFTELPQQITVSSRSTLNDKPGQHLIEQLAISPGLDMQSNGLALMNPGVRGLSGSRIQIRQFGIPLNNFSWNPEQDAGIISAGMGAVELVHGATSAFFGRSAEGAVLWVHAPKAAPAGVIQGYLSGTFHSNTVGLNAEAGIQGTSENGFFWGVNTSMQSHTSYVQGNGDEVRKNTEDLAYALNSGYSGTEMAGYGGINRKWGSSRVNYAYKLKKSGIIRATSDTLLEPGLLTDQERERNFNDLYQQENAHLIATEHFIPAGKSSLHLLAGYYKNELSRIEPRSAFVTANLPQAHIATSYVEGKWNSDPGKNKGLSLGLSYENSKHENAGVGGELPDASTTTLGLFANARYTKKKWNFLAAARFDQSKMELEKNPHAVFDSTDFRKQKVNNDYSVVNGSAGLVFAPSRDWSFKLNASSGFALPDYRQLYAYGVPYASGYFEIGNDSLQLEQNMELSAGVSFTKPNLNAGLNIYHSFLRNHIYLQPTGGMQEVKLDGVDTTISSYIYDQDDGTISGAECFLEVHPVAVEWIHFKIAAAFLEAKRENGSYLPGQPVARFSQRLEFRAKKFNYLLKPYLAILFNSWLEQKKIASYETVSPSYSRLDLEMGGRFKWSHQYLDLRIIIRNLTNEGYIHHLSQLKYAGIRDMGRNFNISLRIPFGIIRPQ